MNILLTGYFLNREKFAVDKWSVQDKTFTFMNKEYTRQVIAIHTPEDMIDFLTSVVSDDFIIRIRYDAKESLDGTIINASANLCYIGRGCERGDE